MRKGEEDGREGDNGDGTNRMFYCAEDAKRTVSITKRKLCTLFRVQYSSTLRTLHELSFRTIDWSPHTIAAPPAFADRNGTRPRVLFPRCRLLLPPPPPLLLLLLPLLPLPPPL